jgi:hypothetical protein
VCIPGDLCRKAEILTLPHLRKHRGIRKFPCSASEPLFVANSTTVWHPDGTPEALSGHAIPSLRAGKYDGFQVWRVRYHWGRRPFAPSSPSQSHPSRPVERMEAAGTHEAYLAFDGALAAAAPSLQRCGALCIRSALVHHLSTLYRRRALRNNTILLAKTGQLLVTERGVPNGYNTVIELAVEPGGA